MEDENHNDSKSDTSELSQLHSLMSPLDYRPKNIYEPTDGYPFAP